MYELFIHAAALLFFGFFAVNFYASQLRNDERLIKKFSLEEVHDDMLE